MHQTSKFTVSVFQVLLPQWKTTTRYHYRNNGSKIGAGIQSIWELRDTSRQIPHCRHRMSSAIVLEGTIVYVYTTYQVGKCEWKSFSRLLEAVSRLTSSLRGKHLSRFKVAMTHNFPLLCSSFMFCACRMTSFCHDAASRFIYIISRANKSRPYMLPEDLAPLIQDVVDSHPGLAFLKEAAEFHSRYVHTVIARIFYSVNRSWSGRITIGELRKSNLMEVIQLLEEEEDINQIMAYFSYEHFYVIYCKFWELDRDHDLFIDQQDLARHNDQGELTAMPDFITRWLIGMYLHHSSFVANDREDIFGLCDSWSRPTKRTKRSECFAHVIHRFCLVPASWRG